MFTKRSLIVLLVGLNLLLFVILVIGTYSLPGAYAQTGGRAGDFALVTAKVAGQSYDAVYVLDRPARKLYALYATGGQNTRLTPAQFRDLVKDFRQP